MRRPSSRSQYLSFAVLLPGLIVASCAPGVARDRSHDAGRSLRTPGPDDGSPRDYPGLANVVAYRADCLVGGAPAGVAGFDTLAALGVRTVISVDGAAPDVGAARARGMRYVHLPIGYDGFDDTRRLELARAARDAVAQGTVYVHCHHGMHRAAAAAGALAVTLGWSSPDAMIARMRVSGTSPSYPGLYASTARATPVAMGVLDAIPADFPSVERPAGLVRSMVEIEATITRLDAIARAGWTTPSDHPDLVPAAEAGRLADLLRVLEDDPQVREHTPDFIALLHSSRDAAQGLEALVAAGPPGAAPTTDGGSDAARRTAALARVSASCRACHVRHRDAPSGGKTIGAGVTRR